MTEKKTDTNEISAMVEAEPRRALRNGRGRMTVSGWKGTARVPKRVTLTEDELGERSQRLACLRPEIERIELKIEPDVRAINLLKAEMKRLAEVVNQGVEIVDVEVMEVPDEKLRVVRYVDIDGNVVGDRLFTDADLQEKLV